LSLVDVQLLAEVRDQENDSDLTRTLIHEYAHALLHFDVDDDTDRSRREVEAEAVTYVVRRYCELNTSGSAFYLAAWQSDDPEVVRKRLGRISRTAEELIDVLEESCTCPDWQQCSPEGGCKHLGRVDHEIKRGRVPRPDGRLPSP
jgi:hypothetical protein